MKPKQHQIDLAKKGTKILQENMLVYFSCEERVGKSLVTILIAERIKKIKSVLIITKKKSLDGWQDTLNRYDHKKEYYVTNYHQVKKIDRDFDLVILDESHNYVSGFPKRSTMWTQIKKVTRLKPIIYTSATPFAQGYHLLYHQFKLSDWSPWAEWKNAYDWFREFGVPESIWISGREIKQYHNVEDRVFDMVKHLFITMTRKEAGFHIEPIDRIHYVKLNKTTKDAYNAITRDRVIQIKDKILVCDTIAKLRVSLHMLEGGVAIINENDSKEYITLNNNEKIMYILEYFGDSKDMVIMYHYIAEKTKLKEVFKQATILQATAFSEGVDLSDYRHLIIYSQDFSTAKHTQRRARQANMYREEPIIVHYLLVENAISDEAYQAVAVNKVNYVDKLYNGKLLT
jgi:hypothetical protein